MARKEEVTLEQRLTEYGEATRVVDVQAMNYVEARVLGVEGALEAGRVLDEALADLKRAERRLERTRKRLVKAAA